MPICAQAVLGQEAGWLTNGELWWLTVMARMRPGQTLDAVNASLDVRSDELFATTVPATASADEADDYRSLRLRAEAVPAGVSAVRDQFGDPLLLLLLITALVLLLLCANLASLILSRVVTRRPEFALRLAMGASGGDIMRAIVVENGLIAAAGAALGLALSGVLSRLLLTFLGPDVAIDTGGGARTVAFVVLSAAAACVMFGVVPAWRSARSAAALSLAAGGARRRQISGGGRLRQGLVMVQVAISLVLLAGAFLFGQTLRNLLTVESGFRTAGLMIARVDLARLALEPAAQRVVRRNALEAVRQLPGVVAAAEVCHVPLSGTGTGAAVRLDGAEPSARAAVRVNGVSDGYFTAMGIALTAGRDFTASDLATSPSVAIVNDVLARRLGIAGNPVERRFRVENAGDAIVEIVGVAANTKHFSLREEFLPMAFVPMAQIGDPRPFTDFVIRSASSSAVAEDVRRAIRSMGPGVGVDVREFAESLRQGLVRERMVAALSGFFGALAVAIAVVGLYGTILELVARRRAEIGLRMALGATRGAIVAMVFRSAAVAVGLGLALGTLFVSAAAEPVRALGFGVAALDAAVLGAACAVLAATAAGATLWPAYRAASTPPLTALRDS